MAFQLQWEENVRCLAEFKTELARTEAKLTSVEAGEWSLTKCSEWYRPCSPHHGAGEERPSGVFPVLGCGLMAENNLANGFHTTSLQKKKKKWCFQGPADSQLGFSLCLRKKRPPGDSAAVFLSCLLHFCKLLLALWAVMFSLKSIYWKTAGCVPTCRQGWWVGENPRRVGAGPAKGKGAGAWATATPPAPHGYPRGAPRSSLDAEGGG